MSKALITQAKLDAIERLLAEGDLACLDKSGRLEYMRSMCKLLGISMLGAPFDFIKLNGKVQMYANAKSGAQLRAVYKISCKITMRERVDGLYVVTGDFTDKTGRTDSAIGAVNIKGLAGEALANAMMKAETKCKRRGTLSIAGLGMLDSDTAKELAEIESKVATERKVEESGAVLNETKERPEFEKELETPSIEQPAPAPDPTNTEYKLKSIKGQIGKTCRQLPLKKLMAWIKSFDELAATGQPLHPHVQDDAFHIRAFLDEGKQP